MPTTLNQYILGRTLGSGVSCKVKLAKDQAGTRYAIKIIHSDESFQELIDTEVSALAQLQHRNIVRLVEVSQGEQHNPKKGRKQVKFIVLELVGGGELFDFVALGGRLSEATARYYFKQLLDGLGFMHAQGYAHRDLKPENLLLDRDYVLKITDLGFAAPIAGRDNSGLLQTQLGTASYMAPEIHLGKEYEGARVDLFASAITLFTIVARRPPFTSANPKDPHYKMIATGRADLFWQAQVEAEDGEDIFSAELKDLLEKMMTFKPDNRLTIEQINEHPWMQGAVPSEEEVQAEFAQKKSIVDAEAKNEREDKRIQRQQAHVERRVRRGAHNNQEQEEGEAVENQREAWESLDIEEYGPYYVQDYTQFFMTSQPLDYFNDLIEYLTRSGINHAISSSSLRVKFNHRIGVRSPAAEEESKSATENQAGQDLKVDIQILMVNDNKSCVKFTYKDASTKVQVGTNQEILDHFASIRDDESLRMFCDTTFDDEGQQ